jgi:transposase
LSYRNHLVQETVRFKQMAAQIHVSKELHKAHVQQLKALEKTRAAVEKQLRALVETYRGVGKQVEALTAVSGFGFLTALVIVAKLPAERLRNGKAAAAYAGLAPSERQSGTSVHGKPRICKTGNASLRRDLYMPAVVAMRHNPILRAFAEGLKQRGKPAKVIVAAVMRKLVVLAFTILKRDLNSRAALAV